MTLGILGYDFQCTSCADLKAKMERRFGGFEQCVPQSPCSFERHDDSLIMISTPFLHDPNLPSPSQSNLFYI